MSQVEIPSERGTRWQFMTTEVVAERLRAAADRDSIRHADVILNAIDDHAPQLDDIVRTHLEKDVVDSPVFGRRRRPRPEPRASIMVRGLTQRQRAILTREAKKRGVSAPTLVTAVLDHALPPVDAA